MAKIVVALVKGSQVIGCFKADDEPLSPSPNDALSYDSPASAKLEARTNNKQWDLQPGESFVAMQTAGNGFYELI